MKKFTYILFACLLFFIFGCAMTLTKAQQEKIDRIDSDAAKLIVDIQDKVKQNPVSSLEKKTTLLQKILDYADAVRSNPEKFNDETVEDFSKRIDILKDNINNYLDIKIDSDISFNVGEYKISGLSKQARVEMDSLVSKMIASLDTIQKKYPKEKISIYLKVVGYTDETPFKAGTALEQDILRELVSNVPADKEERRKAYNKVLSEFRAKTLWNYIHDALSRQVPHVSFSEKVIGAGEDLPDKDISYGARDNKRRVCIISPLIDIEIN